jgi:hypothetical protein
MNHVIYLISNKKKGKNWENFPSGIFWNNGKTKYTDPSNALRNVVPQTSFN